MRKQIFYFLVTFFALLLTISCDREISVSDPQEFEVGIAEYYISTNPIGARIYYDDKFTGKTTPDTVKWISSGEHTFRVQLFPFLDYSFSQNIIDDSMLIEEYDYYSNPLNTGSIKFLSNPHGAKVYFDDSLMNFKTPYVLENVELGEHKIKYTFPEHRADSLSTFVLPQEQELVELYLVDTTIWIYFNTDNSYITDNTITDICIDDNNVFWIGTGHQGIIKIEDGKKEFINTNNSNLPNNIIHRIKKDKDNNIWVGTYSGIAKINGEVITSYNASNSPLPNNFIRDFDFDFKNNIWIGTENGLAVFNGNEWEIFNTNNSGIPENFITAVMIDNRNTTWIGLNEFNTAYLDQFSRWHELQTDNNPIGDSVSDLIISFDNRLWIGLITEFTNPLNPVKPGGIYVWEEDALVQYNFHIHNKSVNRFYLDDLDNLWVGTKSGVLKIKSKIDYELFTANTSGLPVDDVLAIAKDANGDMWFGTNGGGLVHFKITKLNN